MEQSWTGLEWAGERELTALEEENDAGPLGCYLAVTKRAREAQSIAEGRAMADV